MVTLWVCKRRSSSTVISCAKRVTRKPGLVNISTTRLFSIFSLHANNISGRKRVCQGICGLPTCPLALAAANPVVSGFPSTARPFEVLMGKNPGSPHHFYDLFEQGRFL